MERKLSANWSNNKDCLTQGLHYIWTCKQYRLNLLFLLPIKFFKSLKQGLPSEGMWLKLFHCPWKIDSKPLRNVPNIIWQFNGPLAVSDLICIYIYKRLSILFCFFPITESVVRSPKKYILKIQGTNKLISSHYSNANLAQQKRLHLT